MQDRQRLAQLFNEVDEDLSRYINKTKNTIIPADQSYAIKQKQDELRGVKKQGFAEDKTINKAVFVIDRGDDELTAKRILNTLRVKIALGKYTDNLKLLDSENELNHDNIGSMITGLRKDLQNAIEVNLKLNSEYKKHFRTYHQGRVEGLGIFSSWMHKTFAQSQCMIALEKASARVETYQNSLNDKKTLAH